ncbi:ribosomal RNA-processing protein 7 homolog A [Tribolium madens]|uniref:ribosomal RNA-processing protein 7 homolog A n=1 Tax=Tribolium madens TaxID=41895 RepID=UPI001CF72CE6|nr:ribosomal RNA-processing protein 7 homolog A [Tribolium madens]
MTTQSVQGFTVIPFYFSSDSTDHHDMFLKEHSVRNFEEKKPPGKTLFVLNVPPYLTEEHMKDVFSPAGKVQSVMLQTSVNETNELCGFKIAYVVFTKRESLLKALKLERLTLLNSRNVLLGVSKWIHEYNSTVYNHEKLNEEVNNYIKQHEKEEEEKKSSEKQEVDDEGWTVVTKKGRNPGLSRKESVENKLIKKNKIKSKKKELKNFYTFQLKEQKMNNIIALRKSFQESKEKVNLMKKMRNFKPF